MRNYVSRIPFAIARVTRLDSQTRFANNYFHTCILIQPQSNNIAILTLIDVGVNQS